MVFFSGCPGKHVLAVDRGHSREALGSFEALGSSTLITTQAPLNCDLLSSPWSLLLESELWGEAGMSDSWPRHNA